MEEITLTEVQNLENGKRGREREEKITVRGLMCKDLAHRSVKKKNVSFTLIKKRKNWGP